MNKKAIIEIINKTEELQKLIEKQLKIEETRNENSDGVYSLEQMADWTDEIIENAYFLRNCKGKKE